MGSERELAATGSLIFGSGLVGAIAIGCLAPFENIYSPVHVALAFATFMSMAAGNIICMALGAYAGVKYGKHFSLAARGEILLECAVLGYLILLWCSPNFFSDDHWWTSLAVCEWALCILTALYIFALFAMLDRNVPSQTQGEFRSK
jgi:predicted membrane protein